jgi:hypothetical protein
VTRRVGNKGLLQLIDRSLRDGSSIEIDGLGSFQLDGQGEVVFEASGRGRVFVAYAEEDRADASKLYRALEKAGFEPWMDRQNLLPGQNWPRAIERAIELSDYFVGCFSRRSTAKRGYFQSELAYALDVAERVPAEQIFLVPVRLNECILPRRIATVQYVDLFPNWNRGLKALIKALRQRTTDAGEPAS